MAESGNRDRKFSEEEVALIIKRAAELQKAADQIKMYTKRT